MSFRSWLLAAAAGALLGLMQSAVAQQAGPPAEVAKLPDMQESVAPDSARAARRGSSGHVSEEAATGASEVLMENGWDFNKPEMIYGFGSLPANEGKPLARK
jgi:hypothetical protein